MFYTLGFSSSSESLSASTSSNQFFSFCAGIVVSIFSSSSSISSSVDGFEDDREDSGEIEKKSLWSF